MERCCIPKLHNSLCRTSTKPLYLWRFLHVFLESRKKSKKTLTNELRSAIMCKVLSGRAQLTSEHERIWKKLEKSTWQRFLDVINSASRLKRATKVDNFKEQLEWECWKNLKKFWKKYLTKRKRSGKLNNRRRLRCVPCKLNNVTENTKHQKRIWLLKAWKSLWEQPSKHFFEA